MQQSTKHDKSAYFLSWIMEQIATQVLCVHAEMNDPSTDGFWWVGVKPRGLMVKISDGDTKNVHDNNTNHTYIFMNYTKLHSGQCCLSIDRWNMLVRMSVIGQDLLSKRHHHDDDVDFKEYCVMHDS